MDFDKLKLYLPKYLTPENEKNLFDNLKDFPDNIDDRIYNSFSENIIFQGDCIDKMIVINLPSTDTKKRPCLILSNTCDIDINNRRFVNANIIYTPLVDFEDYKKLLKDNGIPEVTIDGHLNDLKKQRISNILFLPRNSITNDSIIFFDKINSCSNSYIDRNKEIEKLFSLSTYGHYLLLFKLSIHFTRIMENFQRG